MTAIDRPETRIAAHAEVVKSLEFTVFKDNLHLLSDANDPKIWQPSDLLPDVGRDGVSGARDKEEIIRQQAQTMSRSLRVVAAGNTITEIATATYAYYLGSLPGVRETSGISSNPIAMSKRLWFAQENRHGIVTRDWTKTSGVYDMHAIDLSAHHLMVNGFDNRADEDVYEDYYYVAKQEPFTRISHMRTGARAKRDQEKAGVEGASVYNEMIVPIVQEEARHGAFYGKIFAGIISLDPDGAVIAIRNMMRKRIVMPAEYVNDGNYPSMSTTLFDRYAFVGNQIGILTLQDNVKLDDLLLNHWDIANLSLSGEAVKAQTEIFEIHERDRQYAEKMDARRQRSINKEPETSDFSWLLPETA